MGEMFRELLQLLLAALGVVTVPEPSILGLTVAVLALSLLVLAIRTLVLTAPGGASPPHPLRAIDVSTLLTQSDPDAAGHPRPRAPGVVRAA